MTNKISQVNHQSQWLNIKVTGVRGSMIGPLEPAVKAVALATKLPTITIAEVFLVTGPPTPVDRNGIFNYQTSSIGCNATSLATKLSSSIAGAHWI